MGAFFTNIQILSKVADKETFAADLIKYTAVEEAKKYFELTTDKETADKSLLLSFKNKSEWLSIYDETTEDQNLKSLKKLAAKFSRKFKTVALAILVNDSDSFYLGLYENGKLLDALNNFKGDIRFDKSEKEAWAKILKKEYSFSDIIEVWKNKGLFVENFLKEIVSYFGIETSEALTGFNYSMEEDIGNKTLLSITDRAAAEEENLGPVKLAFYSGTFGITLEEEETKYCSCALVNEGLPSKGLRINLAGAALENKLLKPERVDMCYSMDFYNIIVDATAELKEERSTNNERLFIAELPELIIKKGVAPKYDLSPGKFKKYIEQLSSVCPKSRCLNGKIQFRGVLKKMIMRFTGVNERLFFLTQRRKWSFRPNTK